MSQSSKRRRTTESTADAAAVAAVERVLIIDFGSQYTQLIARRVREAGVYSEVLSWRSAAAVERALAEGGVRAVILSGGPESAAVSDAPSSPEAVWSCGLPVLGICYGMHHLAGRFGGEVRSAETREFGRAHVTFKGDDALFENLGGERTVWMSHGDEVAALPGGFGVTADGGGVSVAAFSDPERRYYGLQFHPEVEHTPCGADILRRFVRDIAGCGDDWTPAAILEREIERVRTRVGDEEVLLGLSGGVDSSVTAALIHRAIGDRLHCVFVDSGLLREGEAKWVEDTFGAHMGMDLTVVDAADKFLGVLKGVTDPEEKRLRIGEAFVRVFEAEAKRYERAHWLAQGTIYPDVIESARHDSAHLIKSHHNVGGLPEKMDLKLLEPLSDLFKDEVRRLGRDLGLPDELIGRHPFPGPGLAVRIIGEVGVEDLAMLRAADAIFIAELRDRGLYDAVAQAFCVLLPVKSVAVMGDGRHHGRVVVLRAVETVDFMTAHKADLPSEFLDRVATRIVNEVRGVSRVCYDISSKPPGTIEWE